MGMEMFHPDWVYTMSAHDLDSSQVISSHCVDKVEQADLFHKKDSTLCAISVLRNDIRWKISSKKKKIDSKDCLILLFLFISIYGWFLIFVVVESFFSWFTIDLVDLKSTSIEMDL